jgi:hypothetical protein
MTSDLPGDLGSAEPGLEQLLMTLASGATPDELSGEQQALAMFRANIHPPAVGPAWFGAGGPATAPRATPDDMPAGVNHPTRLLRRPSAPRFRLRLAAAAVVLIGGLAAAAYTAVLPAPVQHIAYQAFHILGVPDSHHSRGTASHRSGSHNHSAPGPGAAPGRSSRPASPGRSPSASPRPSAGSSSSPSPARSGSAPAGAASLTASASASQIPAGSSVTIDGQLSRSGKPLPGVTVRLWERTLRHPAWRLIGQARSSAHGGVAILAGLTTDARFRLTDPDGGPSNAVTVTVVPKVAVSLTQGARGVKDFLHVATVYARPGDTVVMEGNQNGTWVAIREQVLNARGRTTFTLGARRYKGVELRVMLEATGWHAAAVGGPITVPPPA